MKYRLHNFSDEKTKREEKVGREGGRGANGSFGNRAGGRGGGKMVHGRVWVEATALPQTCQNGVFAWVPNWEPLYPQTIEALSH